MIDFFRHSLLVRFFLVFVVGFHALMGSMSYYLRITLVRTLHHQIDQEILEAARITLLRLEGGKHAEAKELLGLGNKLFLRLTDANGRILLQSPDMDRVAPISTFPIPKATWAWVEGAAGTAPPIKLVSVRIPEGWIQIARDVHSEEALLGQHRKDMRLLIWLVPFSGVALGYLLVAVGLRPLFRAVIKSVQSVGPDNFLFSVDCTTMPIELQPICKELNRTLQKLKTSFDRLSALNGDLAHEMRTPLHSMQLALECLLDRKNLPPDLEESLIELADTADHMASVLEQMLFLARMEDPSEHLVKQPIDVAELLAMARNPFLALAEERSVRILIQLDGQPHLEGDPALLRQALFNLLGNALRHSPPGGEITLRAHGDSDTTVLEVLDQGHGLPEHIRKNLGQRFLRAESSRERSSGGAGLGLAIVQGIATMHGGRLALEEAAPSGCRATIMFPRN